MTAGYLSYGYNWEGMSENTNTNSLGLGGHYVWSHTHYPSPPVHESEIANPSEMMAIGDGFYGGNAGIGDGSLWLWRTRYAEFLPGSTK